VLANGEAVAVLVSVATVSAITAILPGYIYGYFEMASVVTALGAFALVVVAACFVDPKSHTLKPVTTTTARRALLRFAAVVVIGLVIVSKHRIYLSDQQLDLFEACLSKIGLASPLHYSMSTRKLDCYGTLLSKAVSGGQCKCSLE
jgi:hypothetical protein